MVNDLSGPEPMTPIREPATVRVAMWSSRHRWPVAALWFLGTVGLFVLSLVGGGIRAEDPNGNRNGAQAESARAYAVFDGGASQDPSEDVLVGVTRPTLKVTDPAFQAFVSQAVAGLKALTVDENGGNRPVFDNGAGPATSPPPARLAPPALTAARIAGPVNGGHDTVEPPPGPGPPARA